MLLLRSIYNGVTHRPTLGRLLFLGIAYTVFVCYGAGIYTGKELLTAVLPLLLQISIALMKDD